ncbi:hypothetical protein HGRIS_002979 [Hohenbuehelia grisea]|uniref:Uncharacterized protein n=1 Tax=Hohenbuehelia grisea TaxID=104357 RepID=A0ABR3JMU7_9AGAR
MYSSVGVLAITSDHQLDAVLTYHAGDKSLAYCVITLDLHLSFQSSAPALCRRLRRLLKQTTQIEELILDIPDISALDAQRLLRLPLFLESRGLLDEFPPRHALFDFLVVHPRIIDLSLGFCSLHACPLETIAASELSGIRGPMSCIPRLIRGAPVRSATFLDIGHPDGPHDILDISVALRSSTAFITWVHLEFRSFSLHRDLLRRVFEGAPHISSLKLTKIKVCAEYRPWDDDVRRWARDLAAFAHLKRLLVRTTAPLIKRGGDYVQEKTLLGTWVPYPRRLENVTIWYRSSQGHEQLSHWRWGNSSWHRSLCLVEPDESSFC